MLVWFRHDLRLADHAALAAAAARGRPVAACFVFDERVPYGGAGRWWLHGSLQRLGGALARRGGRLLLRRGETSRALAALAAELGADEIHCSKSYDPAGIAAEARARAALDRAEVKLFTHAGALLFEPELLCTRSGEPYKIFTPFWKACLEAPAPAPPRSPPKRFEWLASSTPGDVLEDWRLRPNAPNWAADFPTYWEPGEDGARRRLDEFLSTALERYAHDRDRTDCDGSSRLSPHLRFGELSPRSTFATVRAAGGAGADAYLRELGWREFAQHTLWHWPDLAAESMRAEFRRFPWREDAAALARWQQGRTGYPFIDAGMRQLWRTGWLHNRARMAVASFLTKDLLVDWRRGAAWFEDTLVDADPANNALNWQWVAGSGVDAAPYFRVFNPTLQGRKFDMEGRYVRRWVPELSRLSHRYIHSPESAPQNVLEAAGVVLDDDYPRPLIEHAAARKRALEAFASVSGRGRVLHRKRRES